MRRSAGLCTPPATGSAHISRRAACIGPTSSHTQRPISPPPAKTSSPGHPPGALGCTGLPVHYGVRGRPPCALVVLWTPPAQNPESRCPRAPHRAARHPRRGVARGARGGGFGDAGPQRDPARARGEGRAANQTLPATTSTRILNPRLVSSVCQHTPVVANNICWASGEGGAERRRR